MIWLSRILDRKSPISKYTSEAKGWTTCALGELFDSLPSPIFDQRTFDPSPKDSKLYNLGMRFYKAVKNNQRGRAFKVYQAILRRIAVLNKVG